MQKEYYDVSVIVLVYNQKLEKVLFTLASIVIQKDVKIQLIIADDGSSADYETEYDAIMKYWNFTDWKLIKHKVNQGTMHNFLDALQVSEGEFVKAISPGDCFSADTVLKEWVEDIRHKDTKISFCDSIYYQKRGNDFECIIEVAHPQHPEIFETQKDQKKQYLLYNDIFLGAALLTERVCTLTYVEKLLDRIMYAEDNIYRVMILDGVSCSYFCKNVIFYEWGSGISTKSDTEFSNRLRADWNNTSDYIWQHCANYGIERKIKKYLLSQQNKSNFWGNSLNRIYFWDVIAYDKKNSQKKRMTQKADVSFLHELNDKVNEIDLQKKPGKITLRKLEKKDAVFMLEWMQDMECVQFLNGDFLHMTLEDCYQFIQESRNSRQNLHLAIAEETDTYMGTVSLKNIDREKECAEFAISMRKSAMGTGISQFAMKKMMEIGFQKLGLKYIYWYVLKENLRAIRFYEKNGYRRMDERLPIAEEKNREILKEKYLWYIEKNGLGSTIYE